MYHCELNVIEDCWIECLGRSLVGKFLLTFWSDKLTALSEEGEGEGKEGRGRDEKRMHNSRLCSQPVNAAGPMPQN